MNNQVTMNDNKRLNDPGPIGSSLEHIMAEIQRIELKLRFRVESLSEGNTSDNDGQFNGLYITKKDIETILNPGIKDKSSPASGTEKTATRASIEILTRLEKSIEIRKTEALAAGVILRLEVLRNLFSLSRFDLDTVLVCLLPEINLKYQRLFAYLQDDVTKKNPTIDLILQLLCDSLESKLKARDFFSAESPLIAHRLICLQDDSGSKQAPLPAKYVRLDERIIGYLLETGGIDTHLSGIAVLVDPQIKIQDIVLAEETKSRFLKLTEQFRDRGLISYLWGH
jgi:hypothetical protein